MHRSRRRIRPQRFNEAEQPLNAAAVRLDDPPSDRPHAQPLRRVGQQPAQHRCQLARILDLEAAPRSSSNCAISLPFACDGPVSTGRPSAAGSSKLWPPIGTRLPPTNAASAAAYSAASSPTLSTNTTRVAPSGARPPLRRMNFTPRAASRSRHIVKTIRMSRHQQQQRIVRQLGMRSEQLLFFAGVSAAGNPGGPRFPVEFPQFPARLHHSGGKLEIEFDIAGHASPRAIGADGDEALGILAGLRRDQATPRRRCRARGRGSGGSAQPISPTAARSRAPPAPRGARSRRTNWARVRFP